MMKQYLSKITYCPKIRGSVAYNNVRTKSVLNRRNEPSAVLQGGSLRSGKSTALGMERCGTESGLCDLGQGA